MTSIGNSAFSGCTSLTAITIPESVTSIEDSAFSGCTSLTTIIIPESVTSIGSYAFHNCSSLTTITIPESVTSIGSYAFRNCSSLTSITIPESVTSIWTEVFYNCSSLTSIVLPKNLKKIGSQALANCLELRDVYCYAESVPSTYSNAFDGSYPEYATLHVPASALNAYKATAPWSSFGKFEAFEITVENITLDQSTATLTEGETLVLTATVAPDDAAEKSISWSSSNPSVATIDNTGKVTAVAPGAATITATANDGSGVSASCEVVVYWGKCSSPDIRYIDGQVKITCDTEGVEFHSNVVVDNAHEYEGEAFDLTATYTITTYATKEDYLNSDVTTVTLYWVDCDENHGGETTDIITIPAKPVLIQTDGGTITVNGLTEGTVVKVNDLNGVEQGTAIATGGTATITTSLTAGSVAIVQMGNHTIKVAIK